jgi:hypothetical protein
VRRFYIASSRDQIDEVCRIAAALEASGMENAFPWPEHLAHRCSHERCGIRDRSDLARRELFAAGWCDLFIGIARLGRGSHVELGAALAVGTARVILVGVDRTDSVFYDATSVERVDNVAALETLLGLAKYGARDVSSPT